MHNILSLIIIVTKIKVTESELTLMRTPVLDLLIISIFLQNTIQNNIGVIIIDIHNVIPK